MQNRLAALGAAALLLTMFLLAGGAALRESVTFDEVAHIGAGMSYVQKLDLRLNDEHPPLAKVLAGLPLAIRGTRADYASPQWVNSTGIFPAFLGEWTFGEWVLNRWNRQETILMWARLPMLMLTVLLGWVIFVFGRRLGGAWGGLLCLAAYITMPAFLTFGPLVITDTAISLFALLTVWALGELWRNPSSRNIRWFALALSGALLSKFSSGILLICAGCFVWSTRRWPVAGKPGAKRALWQGIGMAAAIVYAVYFVLSWNQPVDIPGFAGHPWLSTLVGRPLMPAWLFLRGLGFMLLTSVRPSFLLGHAYPHGVWFYFPVLLVLKSMPGFLGLLAMALVLALYRKRTVIPPELAAHWRAVWVSLIVFTIVCMLGTMDISIRHFTVPLVLVTMLLAPLPGLIGGSTKWRVLAAVLVASCLVGAVRAYPYYMQYSSPSGRGRPLYWLMSDSNVDWGQALPEVDQYARAHGLREVPIDSYGFSDVSARVANARPWDCQAPADSDAGRQVFLSANLLLDAENCEWVLRYPHEPVAAGSMYAVQLPPVIPPAGNPGGPPSAAERRMFLSAPMDIRPIFREVSQHPERMQAVLDGLLAKFREAQAAGARK